MNNEHTCNVDHLGLAMRSAGQDLRAKQEAIQTNKVGAATTIEMLIGPSMSMTYS